ncbi:MAG: hypothetical protein K2L91_08615 [Duncaniella sp.]|nr:hypothetical protein [Duncaniella sp.]MDE5919653.1 hypothetical protein [Duncaniella sp.]MDE6328575.1 hypothetical protein [Duncaniella sp.]MDE6571766.1 hypothetical protein [Duncaniella sp.]MDE6765188.1 hypothetical protein [Duncaniella sp.]
MVARFILLLAAVLSLAGCSDPVDDNRIPYCEVHLTFRTVGEWHLYGVKGDAAAYERYVSTPSLRLPADFPYTALDRTGYGGLLIVADVLGELHVYDLACPYECSPQVRIEVPAGELYARCPSCGSTYEVFSNGGMPRSGPAAERGYALQRYSITSGGALSYKVVTR